MVQQLIYSPHSPLKQLFGRLPYEWQIKFILLVWEAQYRRRRRTWRWTGNYLSSTRPNFGVGQPSLVSVVLPVYNQAQTLAASLESILQQSYPNLELIIVNDGSTDDTPRLLAPYAEHPQVTLINQANQRLSAALNRGFQQARGEFFTWTSGDNLMHPQQVERLVTYLRTRPDVALVYADFELIDDNDRPVKDAKAVFMRGESNTAVVRPRHEPERLNIGFECVVGPCFMYRSFLPRLIGSYNPALEGSEDFDFWIRLNNFFKIRHLGDPQPLYYYRLHQHSMSARMKPRISQQRRWLMEREQQFQQHLQHPLRLIGDEASAQLLTRFTISPTSLPRLEFVRPSTWPIILEESYDAVLVNANSLTDTLLAYRQNSTGRLLCWLNSDQAVTSPLFAALAQADLVITLGETTLNLPNAICAGQPEDVYHLARIFVASRLETQS
jgi:hypothetical protein